MSLTLLPLLGMRLKVEAMLKEFTRSRSSNYVASWVCSCHAVRLLANALIDVNYNMKRNLKVCFGTNGTLFNAFVHLLVLGHVYALVSADKEHART